MDSGTKKFVDSWGMMGPVWGINASVARVHALLIASSEPISLEDIAERLGISKGNASMSLKELKNWGVVTLIKEPGDRQDYYVTDPDIWKIFIAIAKERKRREFDPVLKLVRESLPLIEKDGALVAKRFKDMDELLTTLDTLGEKFLESETVAKSILAFVSSFTKVAKTLRGKK
ncbi:MAG: MarR family transcriptional regulator [Deltaproteobacteria bacterium]|nr:MarR family transcriptional regulator [Deltaproteobacteria bacterium]